MVTLIPAEEVGAKCVEWYSCIIARDIEASIKWRDEITSSIDHMAPSDKVLAFYSLIDYRHSLMIEEQDRTLDDIHLQKIAGIDPLLKYYYYLMSGQNEFYKGRYKAAIKNYSIAEGLLENVSDTYEEAEFYHRIGEGYYRIYQYTFAIAYLERARDIFKSSPMYKERELFTRLVLAGIATECNDFEKAEVLYEELIGESVNYPFAQGLIFQGAAFDRLRRNKQDEAKVLIDAALQLEGHEKSAAGLKTKGELAFWHLRNGNVELGHEILTEVERRALETEDIEYQSRCYVYRHLYIEFDERKVEDGLNELQSKKLFFDAVEIAMDISRFFEKNVEYLKALDYAKKALALKSFQFSVGGDVE